MSVPVDVAEMLSSGNPGFCLLMKFDFLSGTKRVFTGRGELTTPDGYVWEAVGDMISIEGLSTGYGTAAPAGRIIVSGVSAQMLATALGEQEEFEGRPLSIYLQMFDDGSLVGNPLPWGLRIMTSMDITRSGDSRTIAINHESLMTGRNNPAASSYSDRDQQRRFPGDRGCERLSTLINKTERFPDY